ncbi:hypothetical protein DFH09DRAFT_1312612 [Mycena vulgaris]|nr:hypothetical protein DFH09DRAFT_1312612 [Mycena vulgaris]
MQWMSFGGPRGERVRVLGLFDTGCQVGGMDRKFYQERARRLGKMTAPTRHLRMANGNEVVPDGRWVGTVEMGGVQIHGAFDVFDSKGSWQVLFGKPLQAALGVIHDVKEDIVTVNAGGRSATLRNQNPTVVKGWKDVALEAARREASTGGNSCKKPPARRVHSESAPENIDPHQTFGDEQDAVTAEVRGGDRGMLGDAVDGTAMREAALGDESCETSPARRVPIVLDETSNGSADLTGNLDGGGSDSDNDEELRDEAGDGGGVNERATGELEDVDAVLGMATRVAASGEKFCETSPARRVQDLPGYESLDPATVTGNLDVDSSDDEFEDAEEGLESDQGSEWEAVNEDKWFECSAETREASTGVISCAIPPARRVPPAIPPIMSPVNQVSQASSIESIYTRATDPFKPERVAAVLKAVKIGDDLTAQQRDGVRALVAEYPDIFALSVSEVLVVDGPGYAPQIPEGVEFSRGTVPQRPWSRPQTVDVNKQVDGLVAAGVLRRMEPCEVKCVNPISLAEKDQDPGLSLNELIYVVEDECIKHGMVRLQPFSFRLRRPVN